MLRVEADDVPQNDGSILHRSFVSGYIVRLAIELWKDQENPACEGDLRQMWDLLMLNVNALVRPKQEDIDSGLARLLWTPSEYGDERMFDRIELFEWPTASYDGVSVSAALAFHTPLPYAIDLTQVTTSIALAGTGTITNPGTAAYFPVFKVHGPVTSFTITNTTTGEEIGYDSSLPGGAAIAGGDYAEIATFNNTIFLNGNGANLAAGVDADQSEFFALQPGANAILYTGDGGSCDVLWNPAWA